MRDVSILVADSSHWTRSMIRRVLETRFGAAGIYEADDGRRALALLEALQIDLVITALDLVHTTGHSLLDQMAANPKLRRIPALVMAAAHDAPLSAQTLDGIAVRLLSKPFTPDDLESAVRSSWSSAARRNAKRLAGLPPHTLTLEADGGTAAGAVFDVSVTGVAGRFPYRPSFMLYHHYPLTISFDAGADIPPVGPMQGTLIRIEGDIDAAGEEEPPCLLAFHFATAMPPYVRVRLEQLIMRLGANTPEVISDSAGETETALR